MKNIINSAIVIIIALMSVWFIGGIDVKEHLEGMTSIVETQFFYDEEDLYNEVLISQSFPIKITKTREKKIGPLPAWKVKWTYSGNATVSISLQDTSKAAVLVNHKDSIVLNNTILYVDLTNTARKKEILKSSSVLEEPEPVPYQKFEKEAMKQLRNSNKYKEINEMYDSFVVRLSEDFKNYKLRTVGNLIRR